MGWIVYLYASQADVVTDSEIALLGSATFLGMIIFKVIV